MEMVFWHQMNCNSSMRSSCIAWSAWPRSQYFSRTFCARWLIWLTLRFPFFPNSLPYAHNKYTHTTEEIIKFLQDESFLTLKDFKRCKLAGHIFNILFNLNKFMAFESRDPFLIRQVCAQICAMFTIFFFPKLCVILL